MKVQFICNVCFQEVISTGTFSLTKSTACSLYYVDSGTSVLDMNTLLQHPMQLLYTSEEDADK
jgi:hypothetical protein